ncbi:DUF559 domain-containing protein [Cellulomonas shaoxiangyii]|uniref:DUF559 domain-containing protein n=1 Tax=Cellulomonas shaoxiangyii TaxID=2566013 RepID=A0A4P7SKG1_9CELL|nr:DUF559 domain-containing protein [Cellulomonas shaoxiangyii]QCB93636.1 DUF559 domain-containing protein [Cellulomonas shaoxiangyii]TGY84623.1 DUF559 domain-containing protein [Cellulomonas shaoxiangyii]
MPRLIDRDWVPPVARHQCGVFTRRQARTAGLIVDQVRHRVERGVWVPVAGAGLAASATPRSVAADAYAAWLTWPDAVVTLTTAARLHGMPVPDDGAVHVLVPAPRRARGRLRSHEHRWHPSEVTSFADVQVTRPDRTLLDCLAQLPPRDGDRLLAWAGPRRLVTADVLDAWRAGHPGHRGNVRLARAADRLRRGAYSPAEDLLHDLLRGAGITGWVADADLRPLTGVAAVADVWFAAARLVVEVDGRAAHGPDRFQQDRTRQNGLVGAGCTVLRYTWQDLTLRGAAVVGEIRRTLARLLPAGR